MEETIKPNLQPDKGYLSPKNAVHILLVKTDAVYIIIKNCQQAWGVKKPKQEKYYRWRQCFSEGLFDENADAVATGPWSRSLHHLSVASETFSPSGEFQAAMINPTTSHGWEWVFSDPSSNLAEKQHGLQWGQQIWLFFILQNRTPTGSIFDRLPTKVESAQWMMLSASHLNSKRPAFSQ